MAERRITRRELIGTGAAAGVGGAVAGGLAGYFIGNSTSDEGESGATGAATGEEIRAVGIFPLGGFIAADGREMRNGVVMAIDEINANGGLLGSKIKYIEIDDGDSQAEDITTAFNRAVENEDPDVIFSGYHLASGPEFDIVADAERLYFNVNTQQRWIDRYDKSPQRYWGSFQNDPADTWYGGGFALWLDGLVKEGTFKPKEKTAAILSGDDAYDSWIAQNFEKKIKELGWKVTHKGTFTAGKVPDWGPLLAKVRSNPPAILFTTDYNPADDAAMAKQWAQNPVGGTLLYQQYGPSVPEYLKLAKDAANGIIWATVLGLLVDGIGNNFRARYKKKFGAEPGWANAGGCYDEVYVWAKACAAAGTAKDYRRVAKFAEKVIHRGTTGSISFKSHAGLAYPGQTKDPSLGQAHIIVQLQDGQHKVISPDPYTNGKFQPPPWFTA